MGATQKIIQNHNPIKAAAEDISHIILGKENEIKLTLACILARGHLLIEDIPGVGKTTLVKAVAKVLGLQLSRIQMTNDMLPGDIIGYSVFDGGQNSMKFHKGPIFSELVLCDELNRATPRTQSATLQAMEERTVSVDGQNYPLPNPFLVIATQNPRSQVGTFPLPESQLDRFLMKIGLGFMNRDNEILILKGEDRGHAVESIQPKLKIQDVLRAQEEANQVHMSSQVFNYVQDILENSRKQPERFQGLSPRAGIGLARAAKAWAYLEGRDFTICEDVQKVAVSVINHRLISETSSNGSNAGRSLAEEILKTTPIPEIK